MLLDDVLEWIKSLDIQFDNYYIGVLDSKKQKSLGVYNLKRATLPIIALGGLKNTSYNIKRISLLIHWNKASDESESKATELFEILMKAKLKKIGIYDVNFIGMLTNGPVDVGRDDNGICEYVIEFEIYYKKRGG